MIVMIKFDYYSKTVFVPDGYIADTNKLRTDFIEWVKDQPECITVTNGISGLSYDADDFLEYINKIIFADTKEKAFFTDKKEKKEKIKTISF